MQNIILYTNKFYILHRYFRETIITVGRSVLFLTSRSPMILRLLFSVLAISAAACLAKLREIEQNEGDVDNIHYGKRKWKLVKLSSQEYPRARCLDGSMAAYWIIEGTDSGSSKFLTHHQGGAWCNSLEDCSARSLTELGSSKDYMDNIVCEANSPFDEKNFGHDETKEKHAIPCNSDGGMSGLFAYNSVENPLTYNWNKVFIPYCDGASFAGSVDEPVETAKFERFNQWYPSTKLYFRGTDILEAVYDHLLKHKGLDKASDVIISGSSAGGLTTFLNIDKINNIIMKGNYMEKRPLIVGVPDAGYFLNILSYDGLRRMKDKSGMEFAVKVQNTRPALYPQCLEEQTIETQWKCMLPEYYLRFITTPLFIVQSSTDWWQFGNVFGLKCEQDDCTKAEMLHLKNAYNLLRQSITTNIETQTKSSAYFVTRCVYHTMVNHFDIWTNTPVNGKILRDQLIGWYNDKVENGIHSPGSKWSVFDTFWDSNDMYCPGQQGYENHQITKRKGRKEESKELDEKVAIDKDEEKGSHNDELKEKKQHKNVKELSEFKVQILNSGASLRKRADDMVLGVNY